MLSEVLLGKFFKLCILFQKYLPNYPITISKTTLKLSPEKLTFPKHFLFVFFGVLGVRLFLVVYALVVLRILLFLPKASPEYPNTREVIFFLFYFCVANIINFGVNLLLENSGSVADTFNAAFKMLFTFKAQGNLLKKATL